MSPRLKTVVAYGMAIALVAMPLIAIPLVSFAGDGANTGDSTVPPGSKLILTDPLIIPGSPNTTVTINTLIPALINALIQIGLVVIVLAFMWAGFKYVTAFGDPTKIMDAHKIFKYTVIGAAVLLGARALSDILKGTVEAIRTTT